MRSSYSLHLATAFLIVLGACGGGTDAPALAGLGQSCTRTADPSAPNGCPSNSMSCLTFPSAADPNPTKGICTTVCVGNGTLMTDAQGNISSITPDPRVAPQSTMCTGAFTGKTGVAGCEAIFTLSPADATLKPNTTYTALGMACVIECEKMTNKCPGTLKCNTDLGWCTP